MVEENNEIKVIKSSDNFEGKKYLVLFDKKNGLELTFGDSFNSEYPFLLDIGIMGNCKNNCSFCYQGSIDKDNMSLDDYKDIINQSKDYVTQVALGGKGDPNLHPNFEEIIDYTINNNIVPNYTTSGINLTFNQVEISKKCGAVAVSDYDKYFTYNALNSLISNEIKTNIHFLFSKDRFERALQVINGIDIWHKRFDIKKLNAVIFLLLKPKGNASNLNNLVPDDKEIEIFINYIRKNSKKLPFKIGMDSCLVNRIKNLTSLTEDEELLLDTCEASRFSAYITQDKKLLPCSFADKSLAIPITKENNIKNIFSNSELFKSCRNKLREKSTICPFLD